MSSIRPMLRSMVEVVIGCSKERDFRELRQVRNAGTAYAASSIIAVGHGGQLPPSGPHVCVADES
jgi:hypothetical protein